GGSGLSERIEHQRHRGGRPEVRGTPGGHGATSEGHGFNGPRLLVAEEVPAALGTGVFASRRGPARERDRRHAGGAAPGTPRFRLRCSLRNGRPLFAGPDLSALVRPPN